MQPQLHGREHLNVRLWLEILRAGDRELREAFAMGIWSVPADWHRRVKLQAALDYEGAAPFGRATARHFAALAGGEFMGSAKLVGVMGDNDGVTE